MFNNLLQNLDSLDKEFLAVTIAVIVFGLPPLMKSRPIMKTRLLLLKDIRVEKNRRRMTVSELRDLGNNRHILSAYFMDIPVLCLAGLFAAGSLSIVGLLWCLAWQVYWPHLVASFSVSVVIRMNESVDKALSTINAPP